MRERLMKRMAAVAVLVGACGAAMAHAQATREVVLDPNPAWGGRSYVLSLRGKLQVQRTDGWNRPSRLLDYAQVHKGETYLLFEEGGVLYRLDAAADLRTLAELYQPLDHLASLQAELGAAMAPLANQQAVLGSQMRATRDYAAMGRIGREQGSIGRRQGEIGHEQGVIGRQQGILGRVLYQTAQETMDRCLKEKSCSAVTPVAPAAAGL